jgi:hypothetical protein
MKEGYRHEQTVGEVNKRRQINVGLHNREAACCPVNAPFVRLARNCWVSSFLTQVFLISTLKHSS